MNKVGLVQRISFTVFLVGLCCFFVESFYEERVKLLEELNTAYLVIISAVSPVQLSTSIAIITVLSFFVFYFFLGWDDGEK